MSRCRSCSAPIRWERTEALRAMPLDVEPAPLGNVILERDPDREEFVARVLTGAELEVAQASADVTLYLSHFATCPNAASHRRARSVRGSTP